MGREEPGGREAARGPDSASGHEPAHAQRPGTEQKPWTGSQEGWRRAEIQEDWSAVQKATGRRFRETRKGVGFWDAPSQFRDLSQGTSGC